MHAPPPGGIFQQESSGSPRKPRKTRAVSHTLHLPPAKSDSPSQPLRLIDKFMSLNVTEAHAYRQKKKTKTSTSLQWLEANKHLREAELTRNPTGKSGGLHTRAGAGRLLWGRGGGRNGRCWSSACFSFIMHGAQDAEWHADNVETSTRLCSHARRRLGPLTTSPLIWCQD